LNTVCEKFQRPADGGGEDGRSGPPPSAGAGLPLPLPEILVKNAKRSNDHVYKITELVGSSPDSIEDAVNNAVTRASRTLRNLRWFEVTETRGHIDDGKIAHWQVTVKIGFTLDEGA
jgi:hypothetical protein